MARQSRHRNRDRGGENAELVKNIQAAVISAGKFLNSGSEDRNRGSFKDAANKLKVIGVITIEDLKAIGLKGKQPEAAFNAIGNPNAKGNDIVALTSEQKRALVQAGQTRAIAKANKFGLRLAA